MFELLGDPPPQGKEARAALENSLFYSSFVITYQSYQPARPQHPNKQAENMRIYVGRDVSEIFTDDFNSYPHRPLGKHQTQDHLIKLVSVAL